MRTTIRIDDDLLQELREKSHHLQIPLTELVNRMIRRGIMAERNGKAKSRRSYRLATFSMGDPLVSLNKALALAQALEDDEVIEELRRRK